MRDTQDTLGFDSFLKTIHQKISSIAQKRIGRCLGGWEGGGMNAPGSYLMALLLKEL
jgi:hypothetical protein